jgi:hypothetical protein
LAFNPESVTHSAHLLGEPEPEPESAPEPPKVEIPEWRRPSYTVEEFKNPSK